MALKGITILDLYMRVMNHIVNLLEHSNILDEIECTLMLPLTAIDFQYVA